MKGGDIRSRILLAAVVPVTLVAIALAGVFLVARVGDNDEANSLRARSLARQLAAASEYGLFSANSTLLQNIATGGLRESDVRSVAILNAQGNQVAIAGRPAYTRLPSLSTHESVAVDPVTGMNLLLQPIAAAEVRLDELFEPRSAVGASADKPLGYVVIEMSRESAIRRQRDMMLAGALITLAGLLFGVLLAVRLGRSVLRPILRVSSVVERISRGDLSARVEVLPKDPLQGLQRGLNQMATRIESGREDLEKRIVLATAALREKKDEAETATLAKSRFLAAASHDLRQPTHALGMFVARLGQLPHDAQTKQLIANLDLSVQALQDLLDGLLDISRLDAGAVQVQLRAFALSEIFQKVAVEMALPASGKGIRLRVRPTTVGVMSDSSLLHRVLMNLVGNAINYTERGGVLLACRPVADGKRVRIEVWDSGVGIAQEHHQAIFKEFYQVGNAQRDRRKGMGLGLNIVQRSLDLLGHRLQMWSKPGAGTRFSIEVPSTALDAVQERRGPLRSSAFDDLTSLLILIIEDDVLARDGLQSMLSSWGSSVIVADGSSGALSHLKDGALPDVIVSDYRLCDGENGIETIQQLRAFAARPIPACLLSGDTEPSLIQDARDAGLTLLHKPVRPAKLRSLIRRLTKAYQDAPETLV
jgi:signal transduction histidine kinase